MTSMRRIPDLSSCDFLSGISVVRSLLFFRAFLRPLFIDCISDIQSWVRGSAGDLGLDNSKISKKSTGSNDDSS